MKKFITEFKQFINKGNVMDLAVGVIIGGAFQAIINSLVNDILMPILGALTRGVNFQSWKLVIGDASHEDPAILSYGNFIAAVFNFLLMAIVLFLIVKAINKAREVLEKKDETPEKAKTKKCPYCKSEIDIDAVRCPHCTSSLE